MLINPNRVNEIFLDCMFNDDEIVNGTPIVEPIAVDGVTIKIGLHPGRVEAHKAEISQILIQLPEEFKEGWSFLNLCMDKDGNHWAEHRTCEELVMLGLSTGLMEYILPREMWSALPGGMPYVRTNTALVAPTGKAEQMLAKRSKGKISTIHSILGHHSEGTDEKTQIIEVDQSNEESAKMEYKDMSKFRKGREQSRVAQTWLQSYKPKFMNDLVGKDTPAEEIVSKLLWGFNIGHASDLAETVALYTINWLDSKVGRTFLSEVYSIDVPSEAKKVPMSESAKVAFETMFEKSAPETVADANVLNVWNGEYSQQTMNHVIYRYDNHDTVSKEVYNAVNQGSSETAEIVADTLIGWLNSHVGRCFVRKAFEIEILTNDPEGND